MLIKAKNKVTGNVTLVPEKYLKFNKNYKKATKADLKNQDREYGIPDVKQPNVATEENNNGQTHGTK